MNRAVDEIEDETDDDLKDHYDFDYSQARPNRFAARLAEDSLIVVVDPEMAMIFPTSEAVNEALRVLAAAAKNLSAEKPQRRNKLRARAAKVAQT